MINPIATAIANRRRSARLQAHPVVIQPANGGSPWFYELAHSQRPFEIDSWLSDIQCVRPGTRRALSARSAPTDQVNGYTPRSGRAVIDRR